MTRDGLDIDPSQFGGHAWVVQRKAIHRLVAELDLERALGAVCQACLSFVSVPLGDSDHQRARIEARKLTPLLWEEGLAEPALEAVARAYEARVPGAVEGLADLDRSGGGSAVAVEIVLRLAAELDRRTELALRRIGR